MANLNNKPDEGFNPPPQSMAAQTGGTEQEDNKDAFHPDNVGAVQLIVQMRIYDVLFGILKHINEADAKTILDIHNAGGLAGPPPWLAGEEE